MPNRNQQKNSYDWKQVIENIKNSPAVSQEDFLQSTMTNPNFNASAELVAKLRDLSNELRSSDEKDVADIWGIGRKYAEFLKSDDENDNPQLDLWEASGLERLRKKPQIETAYDLKNCDDDWIRKHLTVKGLRLVWELRGISCLPLEMFEKPKKGFAALVRSVTVIKTIDDLRESVAMHAARAGEKLRRQRLAASHITVFISTSRFRLNPAEVYSASASRKMMIPTAYTPALIEAAHSLLERVYKPGYEYRKAGIFLTDITFDNAKQQSFFLKVDDEKQSQIMKAVDKINGRYGRHTVRPGAMGFAHNWKMKQENLSNCYTTRLSEIVNVSAR